MIFSYDSPVHIALVDEMLRRFREWEYKVKCKPEEIEDKPFGLDFLKSTVTNLRTQITW